MRKAFIAVALLLLTAACGPTRLYYWGSTGSGTTRYEDLAYRHYDTQSPESICDLVCLYEDMVTNPGGTRQVPPPGICAEYGFLLLQPNTAEIFAEHASRRQRRMFDSDNYAALFTQRGEEMLAKEMELYPESAQFIGPLLKSLKGGTK